MTFFSWVSYYETNIILANEINFSIRYHIWTPDAVTNIATHDFLLAKT